MKKRQETVLTVAGLAERLGAKLIGPGSGKITGVNSLQEAGPTEVSFISSAKHADRLAGTKAAAVIVSKETGSGNAALLLVEKVEASLITALNLFAPKLTGTGGVHPAAIVEESVSLGDEVEIGAGAYIGRNVSIGKSSIISPGCVIGANSVIGQNTRLDAGVVVYHDCKIGSNCIIQANSAIGSTGYGYYFIDGEHRLIPHNGSVVIEDCVEIGACCCVDRAKFGNTVIGAGTKIDNLVHIAHNVTIGKCCLMAGMTGLSGSSKLGDGVVMGGQSGVSNDVTIGDGAMLGGKCSVLRNVPKGGRVLGTPAIDINQALRNQVHINRLPKMSKTLKELVKKVERLEAAEDNKQ